MSPFINTCLFPCCSEPELKTEAPTGGSSGLNSDMADAFRKLAGILSGAQQARTAAAAAFGFWCRWRSRRPPGPQRPAFQSYRCRSPAAGTELQTQTRLLPAMRVLRPASEPST